MSMAENYAHHSSFIPCTHCDCLGLILNDDCPTCLGAGGWWLNFELLGETFGSDAE